jgi:HrpA-like RNA helicase
LPSSQGRRKLRIWLDKSELLPDLGRKTAGFPLELRLTAAILAAGDLGCGTGEMLAVIALATGETIFIVPGNRERREEAEMVHRKFSVNDGDLVTLLNTWRAYRASNQSGQ